MPGLWSAAALVVALSGCTVGPKYHPPSDASAGAFLQGVSHAFQGSRKAGRWRSPNDGMLRGKWWEIFKDPELNALEEQLNIDNQNIKQAYENFLVARALIREARSQYFPTLTTSPAYSRSASSANLSGAGAARGATGVATFTGQQSTIYSLPVDISWAPDLWGKVRNTVREFQYGAQLSAADLENERLIEQASLAQIFFEIRGQDELQRILNETVEADKKALELAQARYETGVDDALSVVQAQTTLESVQAQAINVGLARAQFEHAIATLIGKPTSSFSIPVKPMTTAPPPIPIGVPSQLLERRPDIAAAERTMAEANAQIGIAYGSLLSNVDSIRGRRRGKLDARETVQLVQPRLGDRRDCLAKRSSMRDCGAPPSTSSSRPTTPRSPATGRPCSPPSSRWRILWRPCASCRSR